MNKKEAIQAMLDGKKVQHEAQSPDAYRHIDGEGKFVGTTGGIEPFERMDLNEMAIGSWQIYEDPKLKVKMWQWVYRPTGGRYTRTTDRFFKNESGFHKGVIGKIIQRADWTEIEVEDSES